MRVSIAMATFNGAAFIKPQLDSFLAQSRLPDELVVTDDCSDDATADIVLAFARVAPFSVRFERNSSAVGPSMNFDRALSLCTGDLVLLSDQDDVWLPGKIEALLNAAATDPEAACWLVDAFLADGALRPTGTTKMGQIRAAGLPESMMVMGCCAAFRRELLDVLLPIPAGQTAHDNWLVQVSDMLSLVRRCPEALQYYRRHGGNVSNFFVNRIATPGWRERLWAPVKRLADRIFAPGALLVDQQFHAMAVERLSSRKAMVRSLVGDAAAEAIIRKAAERAERLGQRQSVRELPRLRRPAAIRSLRLTGLYRGPEGIAGALKDLIVRARQGNSHK